MKKIEPYKEQPERVPDEKIEIVFHQGKRLGPCFGEKEFIYAGEPPSYFNCRSSSGGFYSDAVSEVARRMAEDLDKKIMESLFKPRKPGVK